MEKEFTVFLLDCNGGGTPLYLVTAHSKEEAWEIIRSEWSREYKTDIEYDVKNHLEDVSCIPYLHSSVQTIIDLNQW